MTRQFTKVLLKEVGAGYGFVPLTGSGLSAPSGIPIGTGFGNYIFSLLREIIRGKRSWDPKNPTWPRFDETDLAQVTLGAKQKTAQEWLKGGKLEERGSYFEAIGSLADWRAALTFLSRLPKWEKGQGQILHSELRAPDDTVVDSAFIHVTRNRQPTLGHMMLAHSADALRIQTLLTTNFDTLIEEAFLHQGTPLTTFDVHHRAGLPTAQLVLAQRSIVKLHGGRYGLRANYTLDEDPTEIDKRTFAEYFTGGNESLHNRHGSAEGAASGTQQEPQCRKHLLVMGVSGSDSRTMKLVRHAVEAHRNLKVFWVFHSEPNKRTLKQLREKLALTSDRFHYTSQADLGLFLLSVYQSQYHSLPPAGADYSAFFAYPPNTYSETHHLKSALESGVKKLSNQIKKRSTQLLLVNGKRGVSSVASKTYEGLRRKYRAIWLELDEFADHVDFFIATTNAVARQLGTTMVTPPVSASRSGSGIESCLARLSSLIQASTRPVLLFVNGREGAGSGVLLGQRKWSEATEARFWEHLRELVESDQKKKLLTVVVLTGNDGLEKPSGSAVRGEDQLTLDDCLRIDAKRIFAAICKDSPKEWSWPKARFVFALTLFRRARYPAALISWGLLKANQRLSISQDNDEIRAELCSEFVDSLVACGAIRKSPGGMIWMHADIRNDLYSLLRRDVRRLHGEEATCHQGIADWYVKLFRSSNDPRAALESIYHRLRCAECAREASGDKHVRKELELTSITEAIETLELARDRILISARSASALYILRHVIGRITSAKPTTVFGRHKMEWKQLASVCEDLICDFSRTRGGKVNRRKFVRPLKKAASRPGLARLRAMRQDADGLLQERDYEGCSILLEELFSNLRLDHVKFTEAKLHDGSFVTNMRAVGRTWGLSKRPEREMQLAVRALRTYMFLQKLMAQAAGLVPAGGREKPNPQARVARLQYAEAIYTLVTSITRYVRDHDFLQIENTYIRTHYGVLLAELGRFKEAHRRLNEATGYLSKSSKAEDGLAWAVTELRRAETYLLQARAARRTGQEEIGGGFRSAAAYLDDMRFALERAKQRFVNQRKDVWWWTLLPELELSCFLARKDLLSMKLTERDVDQCREIVGQSLLVVNSDSSRLARLLDLLMAIDNSSGRRLFKAETEQIFKRFRGAQRALGLRKYVNAVKRKYKSLEPTA